MFSAGLNLTLLWAFYLEINICSVSKEQLSVSTLIQIFIHVVSDLSGILLLQNTKMGTGIWEVSNLSNPFSCFTYT